MRTEAGCENRRRLHPRSSCPSREDSSPHSGARGLILALALMALAACQTMADTGAFSAVAYTCASATAALKTAIVFNDRLSPATRGKITSAVMVIDPVCSQAEPPTLTGTALAALQGAAATLTSAAVEAQR